MLINPDELQKELFRIFPTSSAVDNSSGYALPPSVLIRLEELITSAKIQNVFEFGTGQSTTVFLRMGLRVHSLEDSKAWLENTCSAVGGDAADRWIALCQPLRTVFHQGVPFKGWSYSDVIRRALGEADLVLVDSPALPPFREHALLTTLACAPQALIVLDDANIPTVKRFCSAIGRQNPGFLTHFSNIGHGLFFFHSLLSNGNLNYRREWIESLKAWRRFLMA